VCFVGSEDRLFGPGWTPQEDFTALFVGKLMPLHGLETILAAARLAPEVRFRVIGSGQLDRLLDERPPNVEHVPWVEYEQLPAELHRASCALGIFGTSAKAARVIPNKAFQAIACGTPLITADTPAARELLRDGQSALLVPPGDPEALAAALLRVVELGPTLSAGGRSAYEAHASEDVLGARWRELIQSLL
jgi:glycosyltransferase involved in cell wall biosynthesis